LREKKNKRALYGFSATRLNLNQPCAAVLGRYPFLRLPARSLFGQPQGRPL
jgi:hypothetical protein